MTDRVSFLRRFGRDEAGTTVVELAIVVPLLLLMLFALIDYGRLFWIESMAQKATSIAARTAAVRPPVCNNVPTTIAAVATTPGNAAPKYGTLCQGSGVCASGGEQTCALNTGTTTGQEIWDRIEALMPPGSTPANVRLRYIFDGRIGFLGGPYSPIVTVELVNLNFNFVLPLGGLAALAASDATQQSAFANSIALPNMSVSLPGEDLASGASN